MRVVLEADFFEPNQTGQALLVSLFVAILRDDHFLEIEPIDDPRISAWLETHAPALRDEIQLIIDTSLELSARRRSTRTIRISPRKAETSWKPSATILSLPEAVPYLQRPLKILLENGRNDRNFLLSIASRERTEELKRYEGSGCVEFVNAGGLTELKNILHDLGPKEKHSIFVVYDSDALIPGRPSKAAKDVKKFCANHCVAHHQLNRRTAENYLPPSAIEDWAKSDEAKKKCRALRRLRAEQRHHFNIRKGFDGDQGNLDRSIDVDDFYSDVPADVRTVLGSGFGNKVREAFQIGSYFRQTWFLEDDPLREGDQILDSIFSHV